MNNLLIAAGLIAGLAFGLIAGTTGSEPLIAVALGVAPLGEIFVRAIRMVVIPLVGTTIFVGVARLGDIRRLGRLGGVSFAYFWTTQLLGIFIGMSVMSLGLRFAPEVPPPPTTGQVAPELPGAIDFIVSLVPSNPFEAIADGALLPLIVFTILFAAAAGTLEPRARDLLVDIAQAVSDALITLVHWILWIAPIGVFGLAAPIGVTTGWAMIASLGVFIVSVVVALGVLVMGVHFPAVKFLAGISPIHFQRSTLGGQAVAFATTSTPAALPVMMEETEEKLGLDPTVASLVLSLGVSMYRAGSALFQGACVVFLAHLFDVDIPMVAMGGALLATFLVSLTVAPVPSASIMTLAPALETVAVPLDGLAILLGIDRIPDMFRSAVNALGQMAAAAVVDARGGDPGGEGRAALADLAGSTAGTTSEAAP
jgi:Na+/H+-dicarboxylate symporter